MRYDLWEVESGNCLGRHPTDEEALAVVRALVEHYEPDSADDLNLGGEDEAGRFAEPFSGAALLAGIPTLSRT
jgi:hypothetical protein